MGAQRRRVSWARRVGEAIVLTLACLTPWAFGSVEAWAELAIELAIVLLAPIAAFVGWRSGRSPRATCSPGLALAGLAALAVAQATPMPEGLLRHIAPAAAALRSGLAPAAAVHVRNDVGPAVPPPAATISQDPDATLQAAARLAAGWVLFQSVLGLGGGYAALRRLGLALAINATLMTLFAVVQALTWDGKIFWLRPSPATSMGGPFVGHGPLAAYLNLGLGFALAALLRPQPQGTRPGAGGVRFNPWAAYAAVTLAVGIVASGSRSGILAMVASGGILAVVLGRRSFRPVAALVALLALACVAPPTLVQPTSWRRLGSIAEASAYVSRLDAWRTWLRVWWEHPVWGSGLGTFAVATAPHLQTDDGCIFTRAEDEYLDLLVEGGVFGLSLAALGLAAVARLGLRALSMAPSPRDRATMLGGLFGGLTLAVHSLGDFAPHLPGVGVPALILAARLCDLGLRAGSRGRCSATSPPREVGAPLPGDAPPDWDGPGARRARLASAGTWALAGVVTSVVGLWAAGGGRDLARAEAALAGSDVPLPGSSWPTDGERDTPAPVLTRRREALERALVHRPGWAEGHLRLGLTHIVLYRRATEAWIGQEVTDPALAAALADPLRLHRAAHAGSADSVLNHEPVRQHLIPAARSLLEARRRGPTRAATHAALAGLDYLLQDGEPTAAHAARALRLAGADGGLLARVGRAAAQGGDASLAARCWRRSLEVREPGWPEIADASAWELTPEEILDRVLPSGGRFAVRFADRLYAGPDDGAVRARFLHAAIDHLPEDRDLSAAERLEVEARAWAGLGDLQRARDRLDAALGLEPSRGDWRRQLIDWLIAGGDYEGARSHAQIGLHFCPGDPALARALDEATDGLVRGKP